MIVLAVNVNLNHDFNWCIEVSPTCHYQYVILKDVHLLPKTLSFKLIF